MINSLGIVYVTFKDSELIENISRLVIELRKITSKKLKICVIENDSKFAYQLDTLKQINIENVELYFLLGSNGIYREFYSYDIGMNFFNEKELLKKDDCLFITNSTFLSSDVKKEILENIYNNFEINKRTFLGHVDAYPKPPKLDGKYLKKWIRSNSIFGRFDTFLECGSFCPPNNFIPKILDLDINTNDLLIDNSDKHDFLYKQYLETWLLDKYKLENFDQRFPKGIYKEFYNSKGSYIQKVWTIICEHLYTQKIEAKKIKILNTNKS